MARRKKEEIIEDDLDLEPENRTRRIAVSVVFFVLGILFILSWLNLAGKAGEVIYSSFLKTLFGGGFILVPILLFIIGGINISNSLPRLTKKHWFAALFLLLSVLGLLELIFGPETGGLIGRLGRPLENLFDIYVSIIILLAIMLISIFVLLETHISVLDVIKNLWARITNKNQSEDYEIYEGDEDYEEEYEDEEYEEDEPEEKPKKGFKIFGVGKEKKDEEEMEVIGAGSFIPTAYEPPPLSLLSKDKGKASTGDTKANANIIQHTLKNFGINVEINEVSVGPTVTRFAVKPAEGVKLSRIVGLQNELALALAVHPVRVEAPIPGTSLVGIEIPNSTRTIVGLGSALSANEFQNSPNPLTVVLGKDVSGKVYTSNVAKMPHALIAGQTGAGKSVTVHAIITALLYKNGPESLRFIMVDPKRVELTLYDKIPHLLTPVIKTPKKAILALKWAIKEMERRYDVLESESVRDIQSYHKNIVEPAYADVDDTEEADLPERMPYIVIVIDELADIMSTYPKELEAGIVRIAQMARAVGIHLILSTQRPSVNVITGLIKANIPARIALQVSSQIDSRTILDTSGAEKLLSAGDMLFTNGSMSKPVRMQSPFIPEAEVKKVVKYIKKQYQDELPDEISLEETASGGMFSTSLGDEEDDDPLYEDARMAVIEAGKASTSYIQRKLRVGYSRAARLMDMLEENGVIGPQNGSKPREILEEVREDPYEDQYEEPATEAGDEEDYDYEEEE